MQIAQTQIVGDYNDVPLTLLQHPRITVDVLRYMAGLPLLKDVACNSPFTRSLPPTF